MVITNYLFRYLFAVTAFITAVLTLIIMLTQSLRFLELIVETGAPVSSFFMMIIFALPRFLEVILPLAVFGAILFIYNKMVMDNELIVLRAAGFDQKRLMRPAILLSLICCLVLFVFTMWASPVSRLQLEYLDDRVKTEYASLLLREDVFNTIGDGLMVYMDKRLPNGDLSGLVLHDTREKDTPPVTIIATRGKIQMHNGDDITVQIFNGRRQQLAPETGTMNTLYFKEYTIDVSNLKSEKTPHWKHPEERVFTELFKPDMKNAADRGSLKRFQAEIHRRMVAPFAVFNFALIALAALLIGPFNRRGQTKRILTATVIAIILQSLYIALTNAIETQTWVIPVFYAAHIIPVFICLYGLSPGGEAFRKSLFTKNAIYKHQRKTLS